MKKILFFLLCLPLHADQPFEPIFKTGGVAPLVREPGHEHLLQLRSAEQFVRLVGAAPMPVVIKIDKAMRAAAAEQTAVLAEVVKEWPTPLRGCTVDAATQAKLVSALMNGIGQQQAVLPSYIVFYKGSGVTPVLHGPQSIDSLRAAIAERLAYVQQREASCRTRLSMLSDLCSDIYTSIASFIQRMWTTLVGSFAA